MQKSIVKAGLGVALASAALIVSNSAFSATAGGAAVTTTRMQSIADSYHNLGLLNTRATTPNGDSPANHSTATAEICVFCHTPHGGDNSAAVPIWNRQLNTPTAYKRYSSLGSTTFDAQEAPIGSVTIACLSCHDGGQAIDAVLNRPGSGGYYPPNPNGGYGSVPAMGGFQGADQSGGQMAAGIVQNLGTDLSNDHPVSMQYAGGGYTGSAGTVTGPSVDPDFTDPNGNNSFGYKLMAMKAPSANLDTLFWIERGSTKSLDGSKRDREDVILYTRTDLASDPTPQPFVECGSCHDPHNVENPTFLRVSNGLSDGTVANPQPNNDQAFSTAHGNDASGLCLTCHVK